MFKSSHRSEIRKRIEQHHKELLPGKFTAFHKYLNYLSRRENWLVVFLHVTALLFILGFLKLDFFSFINLEKKTAEILIDQRTSNVATIISMTLAVIGLLLGNLAIKDNQTYKLLFVNSRLYLILYYTLSVIFCLIVISTLRDTILEPYFQSFVVAGTYLALLILVGIGYLFSSIINFTNASKIQDILRDQLFTEAKQNLIIRLLGKYSELELRHFLQNKGITFLDKNSIADKTSLTTKSAIKEKLIYDINFKKLSTKLLERNDKNKNHHYINTLSINSFTKEYDNFIWPSMNLVNGAEISFKDCFKFRRSSKHMKQSDEYKNYFDLKLHEYSADGKQNKVDEILSIYGQLFILNMKHQ